MPPQTLGLRVAVHPLILIIVERACAMHGHMMPNTVSLEFYPVLARHPLSIAFSRNQHLFYSKKNVLLFLPRSHLLRSYYVQALAIVRFTILLEGLARIFRSTSGFVVEWLYSQPEESNQRGRA